MKKNIKKLTFEKIELNYCFCNDTIKKGSLYYAIYNSKKECIVRIRRTRVGKFMHWCFFPDECNGYDLFFTNGCIKEIVEFITALYKKNNTK